MRHLIILGQTRLFKALHRAVNARLMANPPYPGWKLPKDGLVASKATASEHRAVFTLTLVPLLLAAAHPDIVPLLDSMTSVLCNSWHSCMSVQISVD